MAINGSYGPAAGSYGQMAYDAGANQENYQRMMQLSDMIMKMRQTNQTYALGTEKNKIDADTSAWQKDSQGRRDTVAEKQLTLEEQLKAAQMETDKARMRLDVWKTQLAQQASQQQQRADIVKSKKGFSPLSMGMMNDFVQGNQWTGTNSLNSASGGAGYIPQQGGMFAGSFDPYQQQ